MYVKQIQPVAAIGVVAAHDFDYDDPGGRQSTAQYNDQDNVGAAGGAVGGETSYWSWRDARNELVTFLNVTIDCNSNSVDI